MQRFFGSVATACVLSAVGLLALPPAACAQSDPPQWTLAPELRIGSETAGPAYQFSSITTITAEDSAVYVLVGAQEIRQFDAAGKFVRTIGRRGAGPGEFAHVSQIGFVGDTLYALDPQQRRTTFFRRDGTPLGTLAWTAPADPGSNALFNDASPSVLLRNGPALGVATVSHVGDAAARVTAVPILRMTRAGVATDTVGWKSVVHETLAFVNPDPNAWPRYESGTQLYNDSPLVAFDAARSRIVLVDRSAATSARAATFRVTAMGLAHDTVFSRVYSYVPAPTDPARADSFVRTAQNNAHNQTLQQVRAAVYVPAFYPPIASVLVGEDGSIWLAPEAERATRDWTIVGADGSLLATLALPPKTTLLAASTRTVWGVETDADDVPTLVRYRVVQ